MRQSNLHRTLAAALTLLLVISPAQAQAGPPAEQSAQASGLPLAIGAWETCVAKPDGTACWMELENQPGCYVWNSHPQPDETVTWTAGCSGGLAQGDGTLTWRYGEDKTSTNTGRLRDGQYHGLWVLRYDDGAVHKGPYVDDRRHGQWVLKFADGHVEEGSFVDDKRHGRWVIREADGDVREFTYVNGERQ